mgnify:CR=1 FL=1
MASGIDQTTVRHVAELARLKITDQEAALYADQLSRILDYVRQLNEVPTEGVPPLDHPHALADVLRDDEPRTGWTTQQALHNAPRHERNSFQVPKVLDKESA